MLTAIRQTTQTCTTINHTQATSPASAQRHTFRIETSVPRTRTCLASLLRVQLFLLPYTKTDVPTLWDRKTHTYFSRYPRSDRLLFVTIHSLPLTTGEKDKMALGREYRVTCACVLPRCVFDKLQQDDGVTGYIVSLRRGEMNIQWSPQVAQVARGGCATVVFVGNREAARQSTLNVSTTRSCSSHREPVGTRKMRVDDNSSLNSCGPSP